MSSRATSSGRATKEHVKHIKQHTFERLYTVARDIQNVGYAKALQQGPVLSLRAAADIKTTLDDLHQSGKKNQIGMCTREYTKGFA